MRLKGDREAIGLPCCCKMIAGWHPPDDEVSQTVGVRHHCQGEAGELLSFARKIHQQGSIGGELLLLQVQ